jgi:hypothetical protein
MSQEGTQEQEGGGRSKGYAYLAQEDLQIKEIRCNRNAELTS